MRRSGGVVLPHFSEASFDDVCRGNAGRRRTVRGGPVSPRIDPHDYVPLAEQGATNREIADRFGVSESTVRRGLQRIGYRRNGLTAPPPAAAEAPPPAPAPPPEPERAAPSPPPEPPAPPPERAASPAPASERPAAAHSERPPAA